MTRPPDPVHQDDIEPSPLHGVYVSHIFGAEAGALVELTITIDDRHLKAQLRPADARQIAGHLFEAAARTEYEGDWVTTAAASDWEQEYIAVIVNMIRNGEVERALTEPDPIP